MRSGKPFFSTTANVKAATAAAAVKPSGNVALAGNDFLKGCSTHLHDATPISTEVPARIAASKIVCSAPLRYWRQKTMSGQCHRYNEYEILPTNGSGWNDRTRAAK